MVIMVFDSGVNENSGSGGGRRPTPSKLHTGKLVIVRTHL